MKMHRPPRFIDRVYPSLTWRFFVDDNRIFLTFDDGPNPEITPFVLNLLQAYQWKATFFCVGENCMRYPELFQRIIQEGHAIGNHTMKHEHAFRTEHNTYLNSIREFDELSAGTLFRPPYGKLTRKLIKTLTPDKQIIMWSWLTYDYHNNVSPETIIAKASKLKAGDIVVLHDNAKLAQRQRILLPKLFEKIHQLGFESDAIKTDLP